MRFNAHFLFNACSVVFPALWWFRRFKGFWGVHVARACMVRMREAGNQSWKVEVGSLRHKGTGIDTKDPLYRYPLSNKGHFDSRKSGYRYRQFFVSIPRAVQQRFNRRFNRRFTGSPPVSIQAIRSIDTEWLNRGLNGSVLGPVPIKFVILL